LVEVPVEAGQIVVDAPVSRRSQLDGLEDSHLDLLIAFVVDLVLTEVDDVGAVFGQYAEMNLRAAGSLESRNCKLRAP
jgi:hypothetical protein